MTGVPHSGWAKRWAKILGMLLPHHWCHWRDLQGNVGGDHLVPESAMEWTSPYTQACICVSLLWELLPPRSTGQMLSLKLSSRARLWMGFCCVQGALLSSKIYVPLPSWYCLPGMMVVSGTTLRRVSLCRGPSWPPSEGIGISSTSSASCPPGKPRGSVGGVPWRGHRLQTLVLDSPCPVMTSLRDARIWVRRLLLFLGLHMYPRPP